MSEDDDKLHLAQEKITRVVDNQLKSLDGLSSNLTILLGFVITAVGLLLSLGRSIITAPPYLGVVSVVLLVGSALVLLISVTFLIYRDAPDPSRLLAAISKPGLRVQQIHADVLASLAKSYHYNQRLTEGLYRLYWFAITLLVGGLIVLVSAVLW